MLLAPQQFTSFVNRRKYKILRIGDRNMWYEGSPCGSQSLWCLPLSSPPYILDRCHVALSAWPASPRDSPVYLSTMIKHLKSFHTSYPSTSCAFCIPKTTSIWRDGRKWELGAQLRVCDPPTSPPRREWWRPHCCYCCYGHSCQRTALFPCRDYLTKRSQASPDTSASWRPGPKSKWRKALYSGALARLRRAGG